MKRLVLMVMLLCACAAPLAGQTVYNPTTIEFDSPDHATVTAYQVEYWVAGVDPATGSPVSSGTLPLSAITSTAPTYRALLSAISPILGIPVGQTYVARLRAVGVTPDLVSERSPASNPFASASVPRTPLAVSVK